MQVISFLFEPMVRANDARIHLFYLLNSYLVATSHRIPHHMYGT